MITGFNIPGLLCLDSRTWPADGFRRARWRLPPRPRYALVGARHPPDPPVHELLQAFALVRLRGVDVAPGVGGDAVHPEKLPRLAPAVAEAGQDFERLPLNDIDPLVLAVRQVEVLLRRVAGERDVPHRPVAQRPGRDALLLHERTLPAEHLDPIVGTVPHVDQSVVRGLGAVDRVAELRGKRGIRVVRPHVGIYGGLAVGAPKPL